MATNIGPKISVEGEAQYRKQMAQIIAQQKALAAEMKATVSGFTSATSAQEKARASASVLDRQIANLTDALKAQQGQLDKAEAKYGSSSKEALAYRTAVYNTTAELNKLKSQLGGTADAVEDTGDAMEEAGRQGVRFGDLIKANVISDFIVDGLREIASAAKDMAASFVQSAADVRAETAQYAQTFGDLAGEADAAIQQVADSANTLPSLLKPAATSIYAFARSSGADTAQAMDLMAQSMQVAVDAAAYYDRSLSDVTETLQSFLKGNYENDAALGVSATETTRNAQAMEMFGQAFNDLTEIQKQQALLQMVVDAQELSGAMGQAAREADGWQNVQGNLNEAWRQFAAVKGQAMLDALIPAMQEVTGLLTGLTDGSLSAGQAMQQAFAFASQQAGQLVAQLPQALSGLGGLGASIASGLSAVLPQVQAAASGLLATLKQGIEANLPQLMDTGLKALTNFTAGLRESAGQLVDQGLSLIVSLAEGIAQGLPSLIEQVPQIVTNIAGIINDNAPKLLSAGLQVIVTLGKGLIQAIPTLLENIPQIVQAIYDVWTAMNWAQLGSSLVKSIASGVKSFAKGIGPSIKSLGENIISTFKGIQWNQLGSQVVNGIINGVKSLVSTVIPAIKSLGTSILNTFKNIDWRQLGNAVITGIINVITAFFSYGSGVIQAVVGLAQSMIDAFLSMDWLQLGQQIVQGLIDGIKGLASGAVDAILGVGDGIVAGLKNVLGIHSPSRVFKDIGENLMQGLAIGMKDGSGEVMETVDDLAAELENRFQSLRQALSTAQDVSDLEYQSWLGGAGADATEAEKAARQLASLNEQLSAQAQTVTAAQLAYDKIVSLYGEASAEAQNYKKTLLEEVVAYQDLQEQIDGLQVDALTAGFDEVKASMDAAAESAELDFKVWQSQFADTVSESEKLQKQLAYQTKEMEAQEKVVQAAQDTYKELCDTYGETSDEAAAFRSTLTQEINTYEDLKDAVAETTDALEESQDKLAQFRKEAETVFNAADNFSGKVSSLGNALSDLGDKFGLDVVSNLGEMISTFGDGASSLLGFAGTVSQVVSAGSELLSALGGMESVGGLLSTIGSALSSGLGGIASTIAGAVGSVGSLGSVFAGLASTASGAVGSIGAALTGLVGATGPVGIVIAAVAALGGTLLVAGADGDTLGEKLSNVFKGIGQTISNLVSSAFNWGRDLIEGIGEGIASAANWLFSGVKSIAQGIASFLHFSRPDKGPLREYEQWMPDMIAGMARGIRLNTGVLEGAAQDAASRMQSALTIPADVAAAAVGTAPAQSAGRSLSITIGDVIVNGSSVQDVDELADLVVQKITRQVRRKEAVYGMV